MEHFILAHRTAGSRLGADEAPLKNNDKVVTFPTESLAKDYATQKNAEKISPHVFYTAEPIEYLAVYQ